MGVVWQDILHHVSAEISGSKVKLCHVTGEISGHRVKGSVYLSCVSGNIESCGIKFTAGHMVMTGWVIGKMICNFLIS